MPDSAVSLEYLLDHIWIVGDPDAVAEKLDREAWVRSMTLLKERVLSRL